MTTGYDVWLEERADKVYGGKRAHLTLIEEMQKVIDELLVTNENLRKRLGVVMSNEYKDWVEEDRYEKVLMTNYLIRIANSPEVVAKSLAREVLERLGIDYETL